MTINPEKKSPAGGQAERDTVKLDQQSKSQTQNRAANDNAQALHSDRDTDLPENSDTKVDNSRNNGFAFLTLPEPWEDEVDLGVVLRNIAESLDVYLHLPNHAPNLLALWACMTWIHSGIKEYAPYLFLTAATKGAGKTTATSAILSLSRLPVSSGQVTQSALARLIDQYEPTMGFDNVDASLKGNGEAAKRFQQTLLYSFHRDHASYIVSAKRKDASTETWQAEHLNTWCAKVLNGIGRVHPDIMSRCIAVNLVRRPSILADRMSPGDWKKLASVYQRQLMTATLRHEEKILDLIPLTLPDLGTRLGDLWRPLFAIAKVAGGDWMERCEAAMHAFAPEEEEDLSDGELLLRDLNTVFAERQCPEYLDYSELINGLGAESEQWVDYNFSKPINGSQVGQLLQPFGVKSIKRGARGMQKKVIFFSDIQKAYNEYIKNV